MEILYSLRLGSELDCKYGPDLKIKHFFYVKEEKSLKIYGRKKKKTNKAKETQWVYLEWDFIVSQIKIQVSSPNNDNIHI